MLNFSSYIGRVVMIIYMDRTGRLSQRHIEVRSVTDTTVSAFCLAQRAPRVFLRDGILSALPAKQASVSGAVNSKKD
ncbi:hypothetical protein J31TS4_22660 [Paenibacillus sp. J31TS4]|uniref:WYL domain-containing protein n=1 Tax=Paenibacillus sp. J31TS4 TaxID=2807195 RepID=UPI001B280E19|nr:WYL domain-containing protein [Paenibacillus sp. J31TS4]GIP38986.1 hypothetical protein J31TS4_22660 [Paenibacillus sp. J31TS4]